MYRGLRTELQRIALFTAFCGLIGWLLGQVAWCLIAGGAMYSIFLLRQMQRFYMWLADGQRQAPPHSSGIWGDIFDAIYRMRKVQARQQDRLLAQLNRMQESTAALRDGVVLLDSRCALVFWNDAAGRLLGLKRHIDEHQIFTNLFRDTRFAHYYQQGDYQDPLTIISPFANHIWLEFQINVFGNNEKLMVVRDVTRLRQLEKMRTDFVANVSHELRTPLTVLKGYVETLQDQPDGLSAHWQKALVHMQEQTNRMQALIDDLTLLSRLETGSPQQAISNLSIETIAKRLQHDAQQVYPTHRIELEGPSDLNIKANEIEIYSAFSNLVTNALRYSLEGTTVWMRWQQNEQGVQFSVTDEGPGIAAVHLPRLTERFYRVDAGRNRTNGGTGLGLAIVKHALARNGGQLIIQSTPGKGSTFTCCFFHPASCTDQ